MINLGSNSKLKKLCLFRSKAEEQTGTFHAFRCVTIKLISPTHLDKFNAASINNQLNGNVMKRVGSNVLDKTKRVVSLHKLHLFCIEHYQTLGEHWHGCCTNLHHSCYNHHHRRARAILLKSSFKPLVVYQKWFLELATRVCMYSVFFEFSSESPRIIFLTLL